MLSTYIYVVHSTVKLGKLTSGHSSHTSVVRVHCWTVDHVHHQVQELVILGRVGQYVRVKESVEHIRVVKDAEGR